MMPTPSDPQKQLAAALGRVPSGLFVVTARHGDEETGMLASWVQQCSFNPPRITLAVRPDRDIATWLVAGATFTLNILDDSQTDMIVHFGRGFKRGEPAFVGLEVERTASGPVLSEAHACLECRVVDRVAAGDHDLVIADVIAGRMLGEGHPMVHIRKSGMHY
jgi:flavin reductase (DIM6/NTAB) family NADH-FMN oxidoreductase RutF